MNHTASNKNNNSTHSVKRAHTEKNLYDSSQQQIHTNTHYDAREEASKRDPLTFERAVENGLQSNNVNA